MSIATIITGGFGTFGTPSLIIRDGYSIGAATLTTSRYFFTARDRAFSPGHRPAMVLHMPRPSFRETGNPRETI